jgi:hypothetical protein
MCRDAASQRTPLALEQWASWLLGEVWKRRCVLSEDGVDPMLVAGRPVLRTFAELGTSDAKTAILAVGQLDRGMLGQLARRLGAQMAGTAPGWLGKVGTATIVRAFSEHSPGDGEALLLDAAGGGGAGQMVAAFIDAKQAGAAKHLQLIRSIDPRTEPGSGNGADGLPRFKPVDHSLACQRVRAAIACSDAALDFQASEMFTYYRALALARVEPA